MEPDVYVNCVIIINSCLLIIGFLTNITGCTVILFSQSKHTITNFYLLSLSVSDLLILATGLTASIYSYLLFDGGIPIYCLSWIFQTSVHASELTVTAFTMERYLAICHPFFVRSMSKTSRAKIIIPAIWFVAALAGFISVATYAFMMESYYSNDIPLLEILAAVSSYTVYTRIIVFFTIPMLLITVMYIMIGKKLCESSNERQIIASRINRNNEKALKTFAVIIVVFFVCWAPINLLDVIFENVDKDDVGKYLNCSLVRDIAYSLSAILNPVIYVMMSTKFRESFKDLVSKIKEKLFVLVSPFRNEETEKQTNEVVPLNVMT